LTSLERATPPPPLPQLGGGRSWMRSGSFNSRHQLLQRLDLVGFDRGLVPAQAVEAGEAQGEAGFVPRRFMHAVELELRDQGGAQDAHRAETVHRVIAQ